MAKILEKTLKICFIVIIVLVLLYGLIKTIFMPKEINVYENRKANKVPEVSYASILSSEFQDGFDLALGDQISLASKMKEIYNKTSSKITMKLAEKVFSQHPQKYINMGGMNIFNGTNIVYTPYIFDDIKERLDRNIDYYNNLPSLENFYLFFIEKDTDINFETKEKLGAYEYIKDHININSSHMGKFEINSYEDFEKYFYITDHHWSLDGSYLGYEKVLELLGIQEERVPKGEKFLVCNSFSGSKAVGNYTELFNEPFYAYKYEFPQMEITVDGEKLDYGTQSNYELREGISYGAYYGWDNGNVVFKTGNEEKENILIIGESYDNAILKLLACHFNETHSIDLRNFKELMKSDFHLYDYIKQNNIDKVLLIGNVDYFIMEEFLPEE